MCGPDLVPVKDRGAHRDCLGFNFEEYGFALSIMAGDNFFHCNAPGVVLLIVQINIIHYAFQKKHNELCFYSEEESAMEKTVIRNAYVASQDPLIGNQADLDILIEGNQIEEVGRDINVEDDPDLHANGCIVMTSFFDSNRKLPLPLKSV